MNKVVWISGDSWGDFASLIRSDVFYNDTLGHKFKEQGHSVLEFARGGSNNHTQFKNVMNYSYKCMKNPDMFPDIWIHFWTELGRDIMFRQKAIRASSRYTTEQVLENLNIEEIEEIVKKNSKQLKILFIGGQAPIPKAIQEKFSDRIDFIENWKADILKEELPYNQYMSILSGKDNPNEPLCKLYLNKKQFKYYQKLSINERLILEDSNRFPDNAHPDAKAYLDLWLDIKERYYL